MTDSQITDDNCNSECDWHTTPDSYHCSTHDRHYTKDEFDKLQFPDDKRNGWITIKTLQISCNAINCRFKRENGKCMNVWSKQRKIVDRLLTEQTMEKVDVCEFQERVY